MAGQGEQECSGKKETLFAVVSLAQKKQDVTASLKNVPSHLADTDKNNGLIKVIRVNQKPELMGHSVYN